ncbi:MAG: hypothetical protein ACR2IJ_01045, partial [Fluviibacter sp.]
LSDLAQNGANLFSTDLEKERTAKADAAKLKGESQPKNPGKKDGEIQKGQDGLDYKWDAKAKAWNKVEDGENAPVASDIKLATPLKKGAKGDQVKAVQQLIITKMGGKLKDVPVYSKFAKFGADGKFGNSTSALIPHLKAGFKLTDTSSDMTQELVDKLSAVKESFVFEQEFDMDAFNKSVGSGGGGETGPKKVKKDTGKKASEEKKEVHAAKEENVMKDKVIKNPVDAAKIEKATKEILAAMSGSYEEQDRVYAVFQKDITTADEFEALRQSWNSMKMLPSDLQAAESAWKKYTVAQIADMHKGRTKLVTLQLLFKNLFSDSEIIRLNSYLPDGVKKI